MRHFLSKKFTIFTAFFFLFSTVFSFSLTPVVSATTGYQLNSNPIVDTRPAISGNYVVWTELDISGFTKVFVKDLTKNTAETQIDPNSTYSQSSPAIYGNIVVWLDGNDIRAKDLSTGTFYNVSSGGTYVRTTPAVYQNTVVWVDYRNGPAQIYTRDLSGAGSGVALWSDLNSVQTDPAIYDNYVVWVNSPVGGGSSDLKAKNLSTGQAAPLTSAPGDQRSPAISGTIVAWTDSATKRIYYYDLLNGFPANPSTAGTPISPLSSDPNYKKPDHPAVSGNRVVWEDYRNDPPSYFYADIYMMDVVSGVETPIATDVGTTQHYPVISGDKIVWIDAELPYSIRFLKTDPVTVFSTGFETSPLMTNPTSGWQVGGYPPWNTTVYWGESSYKKHAGTYSAWVAGTNGDAVNHKYADNMNAFARRIVDLTGFNASSLSFWYNIPSVDPLGPYYDFGVVTTYREGTTPTSSDYTYLFGPTYDNSGNQGWIQKTLDLSRYTGSRVIVEWRWISDKAPNSAGEGMYLDDISLVSSTNFPLDRVNVSGPSSVVAGGNATFTAQAVDQYGFPSTLLGFTWTTTGGTITPDPNDSSKATLTAPTTAGSVTVTATATAAGITKSGSASISVVEAILDHITITPLSTTTIPVRTSAQFLAQGYDQFNNPISGLTYTWTATGGTVSPTTGSLTTYTAGKTAGNYQITATSGGKPGILYITLTPGPLDKVVVLPATAIIPKNGTLNLSAQGYDQDNNPISNLTYTWSIESGPGKVTPSPTDSSKAIYDPEGKDEPSPAEVKASATQAGVTRSDTSIISIIGPLASIVVIPSSASFKLGTLPNSQTFTAKGYDASGNSIPGLSFNWSIDPAAPTGWGSIQPAVGTSTTFTVGTKSGTYALKAESGDFQATANITINPGDMVTVDITPAEITLPVDGTQTYTAQAKDANGNPIAGYTYSWSMFGGIGGSISPSTTNDSNPQTTYTAGPNIGDYAVKVQIAGGNPNQWWTASVHLTGGTLSKIVVTPSSVSVAAGESRTFTAQGQDAHGNSTADTDFTWSIDPSAPPGWGTVPSTIGQTTTYTAFKASSSPYKVIASKGGISSETTNTSASVTNIPGPLAHLSIDPISSPQQAGSISITVKGTDNYDNPVGGQPNITLSDQTGTISPSSVTLNNGTYTGSVAITKVKTGDYITANYANMITTTSNPFNIEPGSLGSISINPPSVTLNPREQRLFTPSAVDIYNNSLYGYLTYTWSFSGGNQYLDKTTSDDTGVHLTAPSSGGPYTLTATATRGVTKSGSSNITIQSTSPPPQVVDLSVTDPATGGTLNLSWSAASTATSYKIYRSTAPGAEGYIATTSNTSYQDTGLTNGTRYYYKVSGVNQYGEGSLSAETSGIPTGQSPPSGGNSYWFTWYDSLASSGMNGNWILVGNPSTNTQTATVDIYIGATKMGTYSIAPGGRVTPSYPNTMNGPVRVVSTNSVPIFTSQRVLYLDSFNEVMGVPDSALDTEYYFTWYDSLASSGMNGNWVLVGNPSTNTQTANVDIYIGGTKMGTYSITPGGRVTPSYPNVMNGPVRVVSANGVPIFTSQRVLYKNSFSEVMGIPKKDLTTEYWFTWYDSLASSGMNGNWILVGNPSTNTQTANVDIYIGTTKMNPQPYAIPPGGRVTPSYPNTMNGPVRVVSTNGVSVFTSQRVLYLDSFEEVTGLPTPKLKSDYWFTWYDSLASSGMNGNWILVGNPSTNTQTATVDIYIGATKMGTYSIAPGGRVTPSYPNTMNGPVRVISTNGVKVFTSQRVLYKNSFNEVIGFSF